MRINDLKRNALAKPLTCPAFPPGPYPNMTLGLGSVIHDYLA